MARIAEGGQGRQVGSVIALTTLSPVRPKLRRKLDLRLGLAALFPILGRPLAELAFIHYARWTVLDAVPAPDGSGERVRLKSSYLLFESNYNGSLGAYLNAFADVLPYRLEGFWGKCEEFEPTVLRADGADGRLFAPWAFREYVKRNALKVLHLHAAYPDATVVEVRQALALADERRRAREGHGADLADAVRRTVPLATGPEAPSLSGWQRFRDGFDAQRRALTRSFGVNPFALLAPVDPEQAEGLSGRLSGWPQRNGRLSALTDTHYARLVCVPRNLQDLGQFPPDDLGCPYLLYTSNHCGSEAEHIDRLRRLGPVADEIWGHCPGYPGHDDAAAFAAWAGRHTIETRYFVAGYPPHAVEEIRNALAARATMSDELRRREPSAEWLKGGNG
jgi:hypothetical protein